MTHPPHELSNKSFAKRYFDQLPADDISRRYYAGEKYVPSFANKLKFLFFTESTLAELYRFYPYQLITKRTQQFFKQRQQKYKRNALIISAVSMFTIYQLARRNITIPIFSKFGAFLKTHRLIRQYLCLALLPYAYAQYSVNSYFANQAERLWSIHANRLNKQILTDPDDSEYPIQQLPVSQVHAWRTELIHKYDLPRKWSNEVDIYAAPDYAEVEQWQKVDLAEADDAQGQAAEEGQAEAQEAQQ